MVKSLKICAVIPAFNEEASIGSVVLKAKNHVDKVVVVDDGSTDNTMEVAELAGAEVIRHEKNMGKGAALCTGFKYVSKNPGDIIVTLDADGQHNPDEIPRLLVPIVTDEADVVNGSRYINGNGGNTPLYRRIGQGVLDKVTNINSGLNVTDTQSGFRAFAVHTVPVFRFNQSGLAIESEMLTDAANAGLRIKETEVKVRYDVDCSSEHPVKHGVRVLMNVLYDMELNRPLYYFTVPGLILTVFGLLMGLTFLQSFYNDEGLEFGPTLLMILLTLIGTFMSFTGIILHSMSRLINKLKFE